MLNKYQSEMNKIYSELNQAKIDSNTIKNATPSYSFMRDISTNEQKLHELCFKCKSVRTREEMLGSSIEYLNSKLSEFLKIYVIGENARKKYRYSCYTKSDAEAIDDSKDYLSLIPKIDDLHLYKSTNSSAYSIALE